MSDNKNTKLMNPLRKLETEVAAAKSVKDLFKIDMLMDRYIANYEAGTGRDDGRSRFEREAFAFMEIANNKPEIMQCDRFSIFAGFIKAGYTGLSFSSGKLSVFQRGGKLVVSPDAHGKREMLERMPTIKKVEEGVVVFNKDVFIYNPLEKKVIKHEQEWPTPKASEETVKAAYCRVIFTDGSIKEYAVSLEQLKAARSKSAMREGGELWTKFYEEAAKKTTYNRAFKVLYQVPNTAAIFKQWEGQEEEESPKNEQPSSQESEEVQFQDVTSTTPHQETAAPSEQTIEPTIIKDPVKATGKKNKSEESFLDLD